MSNPTATTAITGPARTHADAAVLLRRPFAPGAIGFRAMTAVPLNGNPYGGAQVAAYLNAQSVTQRLNHAAPGRWRQEFSPLPAGTMPTDTRKIYLVCRLTITLPAVIDGPDVDAVFEDIGEMDAGSYAGLKALYSDARKRAAVTAGIGAYLYTVLAPVVLPIGTADRQVQQVSRGHGKRPLLVLSTATEQWLRGGYAARMSTDAVVRDLGEMLAHGEPETGMGQGDAAEAQPTEPAATQTPHAPGDVPANAANAANAGNAANGVLSVDFGGLGPAA